MKKKEKCLPLYKSQEESRSYLKEIIKNLGRVVKIEHKTKALRIISELNNHLNNPVSTNTV